MNCINPINSENEIDVLRSAKKATSLTTSHKVLSLKDQSLMVTPIRRKLGNLANTPFSSRKFGTCLKNRNENLKEGNLKKSVFPNCNKTVDKFPIMVDHDDIENSYPLSRREFIEMNYPSENKDYFIEKYHREILLAPLDDVEEKDESSLCDNLFDLL